MWYRCSELDVQCTMYQWMVTEIEGGVRPAMSMCKIVDEDALVLPLLFRVDCQAYGTEYG